MQNKINATALLLRVAALLCLLLFFLSCGKRDDRSDVRAQRGEPDEIQTGGSDPFWRELWFYDQAGVGYEFRRTAACGSAQDVYLNLIFPYIPPGDSTATARRETSASSVEPLAEPSLPRPQSLPQDYESRQSPLSPF